VTSFYSSDSAIKEFLKYLDEKQVLGRRFILHDLDDVHLFVAEDVAKPLQVSIMILNGYVH
jgi:ABC-type oligopeptide transport system ATPase subunit